eukprot:PhM_4_TR17575/c0_g1_i1/m.30346
MPRPKVAPRPRGVPSPVLSPMASSQQLRSGDAKLVTPEVAQRVLESLYDNQVEAEGRRRRVQEQREIGRCRLTKRIQERKALEAHVHCESPSSNGPTLSSVTLRSTLREAEQAHLDSNAARLQVLSDHRDFAMSSLRQRHHAREQVERALGTHYSKVKRTVRQRAGLVDDDFPLDAPMSLSLYPNQSAVFDAMRKRHEAAYQDSEDARDVHFSLGDLKARDDVVRSEIKERKGLKVRQVGRRRDVPYESGLVRVCDLRNAFVQNGQVKEKQ